MSAPSETVLQDPYDGSNAAAERSAGSDWGYYGWGASNVLLGALAMVATLPGRTFGLGLITEPLLVALNLNRDTFADINLFATLLGALACFPAGWLIDRIGTRWSYVLVVFGLGAVCWFLSGVTGVVGLVVLVTLTRALGQSALSVVSMAVAGKWFTRNVKAAMAVYSVLVAVGFAISYRLTAKIIEAEGWRDAWSWISLVLMFGLAPLAALLVRSSPGRYLVASKQTSGAPPSQFGFSFESALRMPAFWIFALAASLYGLVVMGMQLFGQAILGEHHFDKQTFYHVGEIGFYIGLGGQFLAGVLSRFISLPRILAIAMLLYAGALLWLTQVETMSQLYGYVAAASISGGIITVVFFAFWPQAFGSGSLGKIQGAAQMLTVVASAVGPKIFSQCDARYHSYSPAFYILAPIVVAFALAAWFVRTPKPGDAQS